MDTPITVTDLLDRWDADHEGAALHATLTELYPLCRSITGDGLRASLGRLRRHVPLTLREVPTGTPVFDWTVPSEWNVREAYLVDPHGRRFADFRDSNLHIVNYSVPVRRRLSLAELRPHLFSLPEHPDWIPYRTSYYRETWGFCLRHRELAALPEGEYEVCIDATLAPGHLTLGEFRIQGATDDEVLFSAHACHPSLANDNLSGMAVAARLAEQLAAVPLRHSYRFVWAPGTIGAITWLALNEALLRRIRHGLVLSCVGDPGRFTYKRSRRGTAEIDRVAAHVLGQAPAGCELLDFTPYGYDERQYCSPGINLPVGSFMRTPNGRYPQYHTSADNPGLVTPAALAESLRQLLRVVRVLEENRRYVNLNPKCEPQLGRRGLYRQMGGSAATRLEEALLWVLNLSDGTSTLLDIAERSALGFDTLAEAARLLTANNLLRAVGPEAT